MAKKRGPPSKGPKSKKPRKASKPTKDQSDKDDIPPSAVPSTSRARLDLESVNYQFSGGSEEEGGTRVQPKKEFVKRVKKASS